MRVFLALGSAIEACRDRFESRLLVLADGIVKRVCCRPVALVHELPQGDGGNRLVNTAG